MNCVVDSRGERGEEILDVATTMKESSWSQEEKLDRMKKKSLIESRTYHDEVEKNNQNN